MQLTVLEAYDEDVYKDIARIHISHRGGVKRARLARITVDGRGSEVLAVRGMDSQKRDFIRLDLEVRDRLGVKLDETYEFAVSPASPYEHVTWACRASDPALRVATWVAIWSFVLGMISLAISLIPLFTK